MTFDRPTAQGGSLPALVQQTPVAAHASLTVAAAIESYLRRLPAPSSRLLYGHDLDDFAEFIGAASRAEAVERLIRDGEGAACLQVNDYVVAMRERGLKPATINHHLAALRFAVRVVRTVGLIPWRLDSPGERNRACRDMRGPSVVGVRALLATAGRSNGICAFRDPALVRCIFTLGLRRAEVSSLDVQHYDRPGHRLAVAGKGGGGERQWLTVPPATAKAIDEYLDERRTPSEGPLFLSADRTPKGRGRRLTPGGIYVVTRRLAGRAGLDRPTTPHRIRHGSISAALDGTGGDVRRVRRFSRHAKVETVIVYDDARRDDAGQIAAMLDASLGTPEQDCREECPPGGPGNPSIVGPAMEQVEVAGTDPAPSSGAFVQTPILDNKFASQNSPFDPPQDEPPDRESSVHAGCTSAAISTVDGRAEQTIAQADRESAPWPTRSRQPGTQAFSPSPEEVARTGSATEFTDSEEGAQDGGKATG